MVEITVMPNNNLKLTATKEEMEDFNFSERSDTELLSALLEPCWTNGQYYVFNADQFGHLSEAPLIADEANIDEEDSVTWTLHGKVWWYPNYMVSNCMEVLRDEGEVVFTYAYDADELEGAISPLLLANFQRR